MAMLPVHSMPEATSGLAESILDTALVIAEEQGWEAVRLTEVAARLGVPASRLLADYRDLDAVADAWFRRGLVAMLADPPGDFADWPACDRLAYCLMAWFDALAPHRAITVQMLRTKAHLPHLHTWVPMIFELSRLIQWWRQAARLQAPYGSRHAQREEIALTALFLATLRVWSGDATPGQRESRRFLHRRLTRLARWLGWDA